MGDTLRGCRARFVAHRDQLGATSTEYGLLISFIALGIVTGVGVFGTALDQVFADFAIWIGIVI